MIEEFIEMGFTTYPNDVQRALGELDVNSFSFLAVVSPSAFVLALGSIMTTQQRCGLKPNDKVTEMVEELIETGKSSYLFKELHKVYARFLLPI